MSWRYKDVDLYPAHYVFMDWSLRRPIVKLFFLAKSV